MHDLSIHNNLRSKMLKTEEISGTVSVVEVTVPANFRLVRFFSLFFILSI